MRSNKFFPAFLLIMVAAIWGVAFIAMKTTLERIDVYSFLSWRFIFATALLILIKPKVIKEFKLPILKKGSLVGLFLSAGYIFQSIGLTKTTVGKTGFITGLYVVITPLIAAVFLKKRVAVWDWASVAIATIGLGLLSFKGFGIGFGELLVLISAIFFSIHILALSEWAAELDVYALATIQLGASAVVTFIASLFKGFEAPPDRGVWEAILFTSIFATAFAFIVQTWTQSFMPATTVAVILTLEAVFAAAFGIFILSEDLTARVALGGILVLSAMYLIIFLEGKNSKIEVSYHD